MCNNNTMNTVSLKCENMIRWLQKNMKIKDGNVIMSKEF